ncbi:MAG: quinone-dependent dihydroorotate dehydrogenase [Myxococcota bacterium]
MLLDLLWAMTRPALFSMDAERAHRFTLETLHSLPGLSRTSMAALASAPDPSLRVRLGPLTLDSPVGLAAGLDKDGEAIDVWPALGFGFIEVGTVTAHPQGGNPQPRLFRLKPEGGLINRMGFNNAGSQVLAENIRALHEAGRWPNIPVGANVGKSKITPLDEAAEDYRTSIERLNGLVDYFTVNVSSPNTPGLRALQSAEKLNALLNAVIPIAAPTPVMVKISPDLADEDLIAAVEVAYQSGCIALIATNTTNARPGQTGRLNETGGLSGAPLWELAQTRIQLALDAASGRIPIIGVGGVRGPAQANALLDMGCAAVQLYTGLIFEGPGLIQKINQGILEHRR